MAEVIVRHPLTGFSGYDRVAGRGLLFHQGFTALVDLTTAQQTKATAAGYTVGATPPTPPFDPFPQYLERGDLVTAIGTPNDSVAVALRAAFVPGKVLNANGTVNAQKKLTVKLTADGLDIEDLIIEDVA